MSRHSLESERDEAYQNLANCIGRMVLGSIEEAELWYYINQYAAAFAKVGEFAEEPEETPLGEALDQGTEP